MKEKLITKKGDELLDFIWERKILIKNNFKYRALGMIPDLVSDKAFVFIFLNEEFERSNTNLRTIFKNVDEVLIIETKEDYLKKVKDNGFKIDEEHTKEVIIHK